MNPKTSRMHNALLAALALGAFLGLPCCTDDRVAGSSVTTGNPTEIQVGFTEHGSEVAFSGRVALYGATQIPVPGFQPAPLDSWDLSDAKVFNLTIASLQDIPDSLWPKGSTVGDSLRLFNLVATNSTRGSITRNLAYRVKKKDFALPEGSWKPGKREGQALVAAGLTVREKWEAYLKPAAINPTKHNYLYLPGTGFSALSKCGRFEFQSIPTGSHPLAFLTTGKNFGSSVPEDSVSVYNVTTVVVSGGVETLSINKFLFRVPPPSD